jgi:hypothetical protein
MAADGSVPDLRARLGATPDWAPEAPDGLLVRYRTPAAEWSDTENLVVYEVPAGFAFWYADGSRFHLDRRGRELWAQWPSHFSIVDIEPYLLGPVLGFALRLGDVLCLHASAVVVDGRAVALVGPSQSGKSTTAAAFGAAGYPVLSDDLVALREVNDVLMAFPGTGRLRLWASSERALFGRFGALPRHAPSWDKATLQLNAHGVEHPEAPLALGAIVILGEREAGADAPRLTPASAAEAFLTIVANSYATYLLDARMRAVEFAQVSRLIARCPVLCVSPSADATRLDALVSTVVDAVRAS